MSINGSQVLSQIESRRSTVNAEAHARGRKLAQLRDEHAQAATQLQEAYLTITQARTALPDAKRRGLAEVDGWLAQQYATRNGEGEDLRRSVERARAAAAAAVEEKDRCKIELDRAQSAWDDARRTTREALSANDPAFAAALQREADAVRRSQAVDDHLAEMSANTQAFANACEADPLFAYCAQRNVGMEGCAGNFITRPLDRLVARFSGYYRHRQMLRDAQVDLEQWVRHQALLHAELSDARHALEAQIETALRSETGRAMQQALSAAKVNLEQAKSRDKAARSELALLVSQQAEFHAERDPRAVQMRQRVLEVLSRTTSQDLARAAAETEDLDDDRAAALAATLRRTLPDLESQIEQANAEFAEAQERQQRLNSLISRFRSEGYDRRYSRFDYGFNTDALISEVLMGEMSVGQAMGRCQSAHRDVTPPPPPPAHSSPSHESSSGGFSSGVGFGGGGGFSTGGGF